jgi:divalent metal cation (Fe/Co/Zn/Cd) transporter
MDRSLDPSELERLRAALDVLSERGVSWRGLRTRRAGSHAWIDVVVLVPGDWTVDAGHAVADEVEATLAALVEHATVITHLEPIPH